MWIATQREVEYKYSTLNRIVTKEFWRRRPFGQEKKGWMLYRRMNGSWRSKYIAIAYNGGVMTQRRICGEDDCYYYDLEYQHSPEAPLRAFSNDDVRMALYVRAVPKNF